jgi:hypothetical protein
MSIFNYIKLDKILRNLDKSGVNSVELELLISMEQDYYTGNSFFKFIQGIGDTLLSNGYLLDSLKNKYKVDKIRLKICDSLNRYNIYYRLASEYMLKNNLILEKQIPNKIKKDLEYKACLKGLEQGREWFKNNLDAINQLIPIKYKLKDDFVIGNKVSVLYEGDLKHPKLEYICYEHWVNHPKYKGVFNALKEVCVLNNGDNFIERAFKNEINYFTTRVKRRNGKILFSKFLDKKSYDYLFDETVSFIIEHGEQNNLIELYFGGREIMPTEVFRGKKAQNDPIIQKYLQGPLKGADQRKFVSVKMVND